MTTTTTTTTITVRRRVSVCSSGKRWVSDMGMSEERCRWFMFIFIIGRCCSLATRSEAVMLMQIVKRKTEARAKPKPKVAATRGTTSWLRQLAWRGRGRFRLRNLRIHYDYSCILTDMFDAYPKIRYATPCPDLDQAPSQLFLTQ